MYEIEYTDEAIEDLRWFRKHEQNEILDGIEQQLRYEPAVETRNRKKMRRNSKAEWELRVGDFRILYNIEVAIQIVDIRRIGEKRGNAFFFKGRKEEI